MLVNIIDQHLRPTRHGEKCAERCATGCPVLDFESALASPVLPSEIDADRREKERFQALARGDFSHLEGVGDGAGEASQ